MGTAKLLPTTTTYEYTHPTIQVPVTNFLESCLLLTMVKYRSMATSTVVEYEFAEAMYRRFDITMQG